MKKTILSATLVVGLSATLYGQGVFIDNTAGGGLVNGASPGDTINVTLMGGTVGGSLAPVVSLTAGALLNLGNGLVFDSNGVAYNIPGVAANANATLQMQFWTGSAPNYAAAVQAGAAVADSGPYSNPTAGAPNIPPSAMAGMPNVTLTSVPEPSTLALAGFGAAALLMYRRRSA